MTDERFEMSKMLEIMLIPEHGLLTGVFLNGRERLGSRARPMSCRFLVMDFLLSHAFLICGLKNRIQMRQT